MTKFFGVEFGKKEEVGANHLAHLKNQYAHNVNAAVCNNCMKQVEHHNSCIKSVRACCPIPSAKCPLL